MGRMQTIERTVSILRALADSGGAGVSQIARVTDLPKSTVHRILASLDELGLVERIDASGRYAIGAGLASLTTTVSSVPAIRDMCRPYLRDLVADFGEAAGLTVAEGRSALYLDQVTSDDAVQTRDWTGMRLPLHTVAGGLALMATWSKERISEYASQGLASHTPATADTSERLLAKLEATRRDGYVWTFADFHEEINGVASAIVGRHGGAVASLSAYGPSFRYPGPTDPALIGERIHGLASAISTRLRQ